MVIYSVSNMPAKLKLCIATPEYPPHQWGGLARTVERVAHHARDLGFDVHVALFRVIWDDLVLLDENRITESVQGITLHTLTVGRERRGTADPELWDCPHNLTLTMMYQSLEKLHSQYGFQVLHSFFLYPVGYVAGLIARRFGIPSVLTVVGNDVKKYIFSPEKVGLCRSGLENADIVVALSRDLAEMADALTPVLHKCRIIYNSVYVRASSAVVKHSAIQARSTRIVRRCRGRQTGTAACVEMPGTAGGGKGPSAGTLPTSRSPAYVKAFPPEPKQRLRASIVGRNHLELFRKMVGDKDLLETGSFSRNRIFIPSPADPFRVGCAGIFKYAKGLPYLLKAVSRIRAGRSVVLELRGQLRASEEEPFRRMITAARVEDCVKMMPALSHEDIPAWLVTLDAFVLPSVSEGCPNILMEAMSCGLACVATLTGANNVLIEHGRSGLLVPWGDSEAIARALRRLMDDPELSAALGAEARRRMGLFSSDRERYEWASVYAGLI